MKKVDSTNNRISRVQIDGDEYLRIENSDALRPFFMNVVSDGNHWMFVSSNCGISMGRRNAEYAFFPYYTDDKITESTEITGSKTIFQIQRTTKPYIWEPFSHRCQGKYQITRNLYKNTYGNKILYEEINHNLNLTFRYSWNSSGKFGFVRKSELINDGTGEVSVSLLDGLQNIVPYGVNPDLQNLVSNLVDAYKRSELVKQAGLGIYSLSAIIVDKAEPSEALKANIAWSTGLEDPQYLLSSRQLDQFRKGEGVQQETDVKGEKGAYFVHTDITLAGNGRQEWMILADVNKDHSDVAAILNSIHSEKELDKQVSQDVERGTKRLIELIGASDGLQHTSDQLKDTRHFSNTLFNVMRGGIFDLNYQIEKWDLKNYLLKANSRVHQKFSHQIDKLPDSFALCELKALVDQSEDAAFRRLCIEYLPLKFSRRHGDPSRPWNRFSINTRNADGSKLLDYEGNWRDIFQNWEALALAYPDFLESMIYKFLNATTFDGYNPYRVTKDGFEWETIEPDNPWSYIGYWGDHQVIYL
ncbi:MAG: hypothetical protein GY751_16160, partial [Bacteroidetes bacterium]|nr:hypothetical protein [Bacteroidota bacterium]